MTTPTNSGRAKRRCTKDVKYSDLSSSPNADFGLVTTKDPDKFRKLLESKKFEHLQVKVVPGSLLNLSWARKDGLREPIMIHDRRGLGLTVPPVEFTVRDVANTIGDQLQISAIEVSSQAELPKWNLSDWASYYEGHKEGMPILNVISLEFSQTQLREQVTSPKACCTLADRLDTPTAYEAYTANTAALLLYTATAAHCSCCPAQFVRDLDWIDKVWPESRRRFREYPQVQYYCLMSLAGSYTDFHIDFGGSSVWYHVLRGSKIFYFAKPTPQNLARSVVVTLQITARTAQRVVLFCTAALHMPAKQSTQGNKLAVLEERDSIYEKWLCSATQESTFYGDLADVCYKVELKAGSTLMIPTGWIHAVYTPENSLLTIHELEARTHVAQKF
eukprot:11475-Heterococcus_DN1.PRE.7